MAVIGSVKLHILARMDDSEVINEIGTIEVDVYTRPIDRSIDTEASAEATMVADFDLAAALRQMAIDLDAGR